MYPEVTATFLTCKRFELFSQTIIAFAENCLDLDLVKQVWIIDDNSSDEDRVKILNLTRELFKNNLYTFYYKTPEEKGYAKSFNLILERAQNQYIWHNEDDWCLIKKGHFIRECFDIINSHTHVKQAIVEAAPNPLPERCQPMRKTQSGVEYSISEVTSSHDWPSFSFRPGVYDIEAMRESVGLCNSNPNRSHAGHPPTVEVDYAVRYCEAGFRSAFTKEQWLTELSRGKPSAFDLNKVDRFREK